MTAYDLANMLEASQVYAEFLGGMRKRLIEEHGFGEDVAEQLVLEMLRAGSRQNGNEE